MAGASKRPSKEEIAKILDPEKIAKFINKDGNLQTILDVLVNRFQQKIKEIIVTNHDFNIDTFKALIEQTGKRKY